MIALNQLSIDLRKHLKKKEAVSESEQLDEKETRIKAEMEGLKFKIDKERKVLEDYNNERVECQKIGTVFVTFQHSSTVNEAIEKYECSFFNAIVTNLFSFIKQPSLFYKGK